MRERIGNATKAAIQAVRIAGTNSSLSCASLHLQYVGLSIMIPHFYPAGNRQSFALRGRAFGYIIQRMGVIPAFVIFGVSMLACIVTGASMVYALCAGLICFFLAALRRGFSVRDTLRMALSGAKRCAVVVRVLILIGLLTALWRSSGTIAFFVYYGVKLITPRLFILVAFALSALLSYAIGTSFGVAGTVGVIMLTIARAGGVNELITAGAVMSGAYFGDRCSPASSCANLVASVANVPLYDHVKRMLRSGLVPTLICVVLYFILSWFNPSSSLDAPMLSSIGQSFDLGWYVLIPAALMLLLPVFRVNVLIAMGASIVSAFVITLAAQGGGLWQTLCSCVAGYSGANAALSSMFNGGGLVSMVKVAAIVLLSSSYSGIFDATAMLSGVQERSSALAEKAGLFPATLLCGTACVMVFCNQTIATIMTDQFMKNAYAKANAPSSDEALDISDSLVVTAGLVPWSLASMGPIAMMGASMGALPYAMLLYVIPLFRLAAYYIRRSRAKRIRIS